MDNGRKEKELNRGNSRNSGSTHSNNNDYFRDHFYFFIITNTQDNAAINSNDDFFLSSLYFMFGLDTVAKVNCLLHASLFQNQIGFTVLWSLPFSCCDYAYFDAFIMCMNNV